MDLELWIQIILLARENDEKHVRFFFVSKACYNYTAFIMDGKTKEELGIQFIKGEKTLKKFEDAFRIFTLLNLMPRRAIYHLTQTLRGLKNITEKKRKVIKDWLSQK